MSGETSYLWQRSLADSRRWQRCPANPEELHAKVSVTGWINRGSKGEMGEDTELEVVQQGAGFLAAEPPACLVAHVCSCECCVPAGWLGSGFPLSRLCLVKSALHSLTFVPGKGVSSPLGLATSAGSSADLGAAQDLEVLALYCFGVAAAMPWLGPGHLVTKVFLNWGSLGITSCRDWLRRNKANCSRADPGTYLRWMK